MGRGGREGFIVGARGKGGSAEGEGVGGVARIWIFVGRGVVILRVFGRFGVVASMVVTSAIATLDEAEGGGGREEEVEARPEVRDGGAGED